MEPTRPSVSGCTIRSDYSLEPSVCWTVPASEASTFIAVAATKVFDLETTIHGSHCGIFSTQIPEGGAFTTVTECLIPPQTLVNSIWTRWSLFTYPTDVSSGSDDGGQGRVTFESMNIPLSLDKHLPGSADCMYRYTGTECPSGHSQISLAVRTSTSTLFCCPFANNLDPELEEVGAFSSMKTIGTNTMIWYDGPMVACVYSDGQSITDGVFPTSPFQSNSHLPTQIVNVLKMKPITIQMTGTPTPGSRASSATPSSTNGTSAVLNTPSKIAIGVGTEKKKKQRDEVLEHKPELDGQPMSKGIYAHEVQDDQIHEIDGTVEPVEIDRSRHIQEIEDTSAPVEAHTTSNVPEMEAVHGTTEIGETPTSDADNTSATPHE